MYTYFKNQLSFVNSAIILDFSNFLIIDLKFKIASKSPNANYPKNIAKQRLDDIRESLTLKNKLNESLTPERNVSLEVSQNYRPNVSSVTNMQTFIKGIV